MGLTKLSPTGADSARDPGMQQKVGAVEEKPAASSGKRSRGSSPVFPDSQPQAPLPDISALGTSLGGQKLLEIFAARGIDPTLVQEWTASSASPDSVHQVASMLGGALEGLASGDLHPRHIERMEKLVIALVVRMHSEGKLEGVLRPLVHAALAKQQPESTEEEREAMLHQFVRMIGVQLAARGLTPETQGNEYVSSEELGAQHLEAARAEMCSIGAPEFREQLERVIQRPFVPGDVELLDGPASFRLRDELIGNAEDSIHLMTWAFYDDATGNETLAQLKAAMERGVDVRVMVDDEVAKEPQHAAIVGKLKAAGIPTVRIPGHHRKIMVVDGHTAIVGGINIGDAYSHRGEAADDPSKCWRDADVAIRGADAVRQAFEIIECLWNEHAPKQEPALSPVVRPTFTGEATSGTAVAVVDDVAASEDADPIFVGLLKAIESCRTPDDGPVDIENAYFILNPALREALLEALGRGVQVRILSNSGESVDVPIISNPIMMSLWEMADAGCEVYLKQGATLHSKLAAVGAELSTVGSYNLHPQSVRFKGETNAFTLGSGPTADIREQFEMDLQDAVRLDPATMERPQKSPLNVLVERFFYDFL